MTGVGLISLSLNQLMQRPLGTQRGLVETEGERAKCLKFFKTFRCRERDFLKKLHECLERDGKVFD